MDKLQVKDFLYGNKTHKLKLEENIIPSLTIKNVANFEENFFSIFHLYIYKKSILPRQGWKVHISCTKLNYQQVLDIVYKFCIENNISFKFIYNKAEFFYCISGENSPLQLGKFITIYPIDKSQFKYIIYSLYKLLENFKGPYVLSDKRYKNSNIYYRYGVIGSDSDYLIAPNGDKVLDERRFYSVPSFEEEPFVNENCIEQENKYIDKIIYPKRIIHQSASGNVYFSIYNEKKAILKEARPYVTGIWGTAIDDLKNEIKIIDMLKGIPGIPRIYSKFIEWENFFVIQEFIDGVTFTEIRADVTLGKDITIHKIIKESIILLKKIHQKNIILNDISPNNFMLCRKTKPYVWICDFGSSFIYNEYSLPHYKLGATEGYYNNTLTNLTAFETDYQKLGYLLMNFIFPSNRLNYIDSSGASSLKQFNLYCKDNEVPISVCKIINLLINQNEGWQEELFTLLNNVDYMEKSLSKEPTPGREILLKKIKNSYLKNLYTIQFVYDKYFNEYHLSPPNISFFNILSGFYIPTLVAGINKHDLILPNDITLGGVDNSNLGFLFNPHLKKEFFSKKTLDLDIINWLRNSTDLSISKGITGFGLILMLCDPKKEIFEIDIYLSIIDKKINDTHLLFNKGENLGLIDGYLGLAYFKLLLYNRNKNKKNLNSSLSIINKIMDCIIKLEPEETLYFPITIGSNTSSPYLMDGLSGFLYLTLELYLMDDLDDTIKTELKYKYIFPCVKSLLKEKWAQYPGFIDGLTGIAYTIFKVGKTFSLNLLLDEAMSILLNAESFNIDKHFCAYIPNRTYSNFTFDFKSGNAGIAYVQYKILESFKKDL